MKLLGFNFSKISGEKNSIEFKNHKIETNVDISEIKVVDSSLLTSNEVVMAVNFTFSLRYVPDIAKMIFEGSILISEDSKTSKELLKDWEAKKLPAGFKLNIFNIVLKKCHIRALSLEEELNLPTHIKLPTLGVRSEEKLEDKSEEKTKE